MLYPRASGRGGDDAGKDRETVLIGELERDIDEGGARRPTREDQPEYGDVRLHNVAEHRPDDRDDRNDVPDARFRGRHGERCPIGDGCHDHPKQDLSGADAAVE